MRRLLYVQPLLASYRNGVVESLSQHYVLTVAAGSAGLAQKGFAQGKTAGATMLDTPVRSWLGGRLLWQQGLVPAWWRVKPDVVLSFANPRFISCWALLVLCRLAGQRFYAHGQGLYAYAQPGLGRRLLYRCLVALSTRYVCYTELSRTSLLAVGCNPDKLVVATNAIEFSSEVLPQEKTYREDGILFVGRLRDGCGLEHLVEAVRWLVGSDRPAVLHVVGGGERLTHYQALYPDEPWIVWHGSVHDDRAVADISRQCRLACYPGDAGLSIVHYFALSLPSLVHGNLSEHMGPEPSYVLPEKNGFLFTKSDDGEGLSNMLCKAWKMPAEQLRKIGENAHDTYLELNRPPLGERFLAVLARDEVAERKA